MTSVKRPASTAATAKRPEIIEIAKGLANVPMCGDFERMISGMLYNPFSPPLMEARHRARILSTAFNNIDPRKYTYETIGDARLEALQKLVGHAGKDCFVEPPFYPDYGCNVSIGEGTFINWGMTILDTSLVVIGKRVMFGCNVAIYTAGHDTSILSRRKQVEFGHPVFIGDDCWIGGNVVILPGVTVGEGCTIGGGSVVTKDIPPFSVAVGNPCHVRRKLQTAEEEEQDPNNAYRDLVPNTIGGASSVGGPGEPLELPEVNGFPGGGHMHGET